MKKPHLKMIPVKDKSYLDIYKFMGYFILN